MEGLERERRRCQNEPTYQRLTWMSMDVIVRPRGSPVDGNSRTDYKMGDDWAVQVQAET